MKTRDAQLFRSRQCGLTLIEIMVAMLLGLVLTGGAIQVFMSNRAAYAFNEGLGRLQENGRFALDALSYNARMAGFVGCLSGVTVNNNLDDPTSLAFDFENPIVGYEANGTEPGETFQPASSNPANSTTAGNWSDALPAELVAGAGSVIPGSDVLVIRNVSPTSHPLVGALWTTDKVVAGAVPADYEVGDVAIVSDCTKASVFQITGIADSSGGGVTSIDVTHTAGGSPGNDLATWDTDQEYVDGAELMRAETWVYYVGRGVGGGPALFQQRLSTSAGASGLVAEELVEAVDTMQILYGIDAGLDGDLDEYETAENVADWAEVVTVRIGLLLRSPDEYGAERDDAIYNVNGTLIDPLADDRRLRQVFTTTVALRNRLP